MQVSTQSTAKLMNQYLIQILSLLFRDVESVTVQAGVIIDMLFNHQLGLATGLEFLVQLLYIPNDQSKYLPLLLMCNLVLRKLSALLLCLLASDSNESQTLICSLFAFSPLTGKV